MITDDQQYQHETWETKAECRNPIYDPDMWWATDKDTQSRQTMRDATRICNTICPVRDQCLTYALTNGEGEGIWGGLTERERKRLNR